jgi:hypothetical protein
MQTALLFQTAFEPPPTQLTVDQAAGIAVNAAAAVQSAKASHARNACNNPGCSNVLGPSEVQLVGGHSCLCAGCRTAHYHGRLCQKQHKSVCKVLAAAEAAQVATASMSQLQQQAACHTTKAC